MGNKKKIIFFTLVLFILSVQIIYAEVTTVGPKILYLKSSARVIGLGGYFTALHDDINAIDENPAGTAEIESVNIHLTGTKWIGDINHLNMKAVLPMGFLKMDKVKLLFTSTLLFYPQVTYFDDTGTDIGQVRLMEGYTGLGVSSLLYKTVQFGVLMKYIYRDIYEEFYSSVTGDIGILFPLKKISSPLYIGIALKNLGYDFNDITLPSQFLIGFSKGYYEDALLFKLDIGTSGLNNSADLIKDMFYSFGCEYNILDAVVFRGGIKYTREEFHPSFGIGTGKKEFKRFSLYWSFDYVYSPLLYIDEYNTHQVSLNIMLFAETEKQRRNRLFQEYSKEGRLYYLKKKYYKAVEKWEEALKNKHSSEIQQLVEETKSILPVRKYKKDRIVYYRKKNIIIEEEEHEVLFNIVEEDISLFEEKNDQLSKDGKEILDLMVKLIKGENYKRVITLIYSRKKAAIHKESNKTSLERAKKICEYLIAHGISKERITYQASDEMNRSIVKNSISDTMHKILLIRWKGEDKERFKYFYFNGLDAYIREGYEQAIENWEEALKIDPGNQEVKRRIKQAKEDMIRRKIQSK
ncbi:MAG: OmpA family protein [Spirochaetes bacterium]|nr:OmpA family protein [Spirochaetota bacterium]